MSTTARQRLIKSMSFTVDNTGREGLAEQPSAEGTELHVACREGELNLYRRALCARWWNLGYEVMKKYPQPTGGSGSP